ncbi:hypothetical protein APE_2598a [Aeropyrum pernix K1]|uniref:Uncharacterized protein n=1 Tax=Aeropyrum pernix (strain ATCC 700893 / DSM 11879 / JCM 9820 / NBRC 100138 / K1) TaxID=272557 RepID=Q05DW5_AERPE|nr:hypothetical protein [Aeropyrum pernix]BAF34836.1 hypothetical protein APE_2598a [Aeropyrum pernix K1]
MSRVRMAGFIEVEGLAINGLLRSARLEECDNPRGWYRVVAEGVDGEVLKTPCAEEDAARRFLAVVNSYLGRWGGLVEGRK